MMASLIDEIHSTSTRQRLLEQLGLVQAATTASHTAGAQPAAKVCLHDLAAWVTPTTHAPAPGPPLALLLPESATKIIE